MSTISASTTSTTAFKITTDTTGALVFQTGASPTTAMTISSAQVVSLANPVTFPNGTAAAPAVTGTDTDTGIFFPAANTLAFSTNGTEDARFDSAGNLGIGVTPSAWNTGSKAIQLGAQGAIEYRGNATSIAMNAYYDSVGWKYIASNAASLYFQYLNSHTWNIAASGTAGNAITWTQAMTLDASGSLGIGATSPFNPGGAGQKGIEIAGSDYGTLYVTSNSRAVTGFLGAETSAALVNVGSRTNHPFVFQTNALERARIDTSGNLALGTTSAGTRLEVVGTGATLSGTAKLVARFVQDTTTYRGVVLGYDSSGQIGIIYPESAGAASNLAFWTYSGSAWGERVRIDSGGNLLVNTTTRTAASITTSGTLQVNKEMIAVGPSAGVFWENRAGGVTSSSNWYGFYAPNSTQSYIWNGAGNIASINNSTGAYTALSDANKKKDFEDSGIGLAAVMQLKPTLFRMLDDAEDAPKQLGFIAQEVNEVIPQAYVESTMVDAGGKNSTYIGLNDRPIIAALTKAIQELNAKVIALENR